MLYIYYIMGHSARTTLAGRLLNNIMNPTPRVSVEDGNIVGNIIMYNVRYPVSPSTVLRFIFGLGAETLLDVPGAA